MLEVDHMDENQEKKTEKVKKKKSAKKIIVNLFMYILLIVCFIALGYSGTVLTNWLITNQKSNEKINEVIKAIENTNFNINPKRIKDEVVGCKFCKFKDLCFRKEEDIWDLKLAVFKEIVGDDNA